jgi:G3E family GTPase
MVPRRIKEPMPLFGPPFVPISTLPTERRTMTSARIAIASGPAPRSPKNASINGGPRKPSGFNLSAILEIAPEFLSSEHAQAEAHSTDLARSQPPATDHNANQVRESDHHESADARERHSHHDDAIKAFVYRSDRPFNPMRLQAYLDDLSQRHGQDMLRYKGVLYLAGEKRRGILQGVHAVIGLGFGRGWAVDEIPASTMVCIGRDLPQGAFAQGLAACLAQ